MPAKPIWLLHISTIRQRISDFPAPVIDRAAIERIFGLRRRQAITLLHRAGGWQAGRTFLVERSHLLDWLERVERGDDFEREIRRRQRLEDVLEDARQTAALRNVRLTVPAAAGGLPEGVVLGPGELRVRFDNAMDLLGRLYRLAQAAGENFEEFSRLVESQEKPG